MCVSTCVQGCALELEVKSQPNRSPKPQCCPAFLWDCGAEAMQGWRMSPSSGEGRGPQAVHLDDWSLLLGKHAFPNSTGPRGLRVFCQNPLPPHLAPGEQQLLQHFTPDLVPARLLRGLEGLAGGNCNAWVKQRGLLRAPSWLHPDVLVGVPEELTARCGVTSAAPGALRGGCLGCRCRRQDRGRAGRTRLRPLMAP